MNSDVGIERGTAIEGLAARLTLVRLVGRVDDLVTAQRRRLSEALSAHFAHKRPGAGVHGHVPREIVVGVEHFPAVGTRKDAILTGRPFHRPRPQGPASCLDRLTGRHGALTQRRRF